jgi:hypothetical protein
MCAQVGHIWNYQATGRTNHEEDHLLRGAFLYDHALAMVLHVGFVHKSLKRFVLQDLPDIC